MSSDQRKLFKALAAQGFTVERTKKGHWMIRDRSGKAITTLAGTASDHRSIRNAIAALRRAGFQWP